ncbi:Cysteine ase protein [Rutstroemia sp. NJR-2017a BVV2]|nr:Cysteine ase protein [Rutstroemia sp. NJR-2017a BVV2]
MSATKRASASLSEPSDSPPTKKPLNSNPTNRIALSKTSTNIPQHPSTSTSSEPTDSTSESDSDSDSSSDSDSEQEIPLIRPLNARPVMRVSALPRSEGLAGLPDFLKRMKEANEELKRKVEAGGRRGLEDVREGESYVEMDLGLGVWEEKKEGVGSEEESEDEEESGSEGEDEDGEGDTRMGDGKAKGKEKKRKNVGIEEV